MLIVKRCNEKSVGIESNFLQLAAASHRLSIVENCINLKQTFKV
jgi:hypothetical protein